MNISHSQVVSRGQGHLWCQEFVHPHCSGHAPQVPDKKMSHAQSLPACTDCVVGQYQTMTCDSGNTAESLYGCMHPTQQCQWKKHKPAGALPDHNRDWHVHCPYCIVGTCLPVQVMPDPCPACTDCIAGQYQTTPCADGNLPNNRACTGAHTSHQAMPIMEA